MARQSSSEFYAASRLKRSRATHAVMEERAAFLIAYAEKHAPVSVRQLYYAAEVAGLPGITKSDGDYDKIQRQVLKLRREGRLSYKHISDATRWMRKFKTYDSAKDAIAEVARLYRQNLWLDIPERCEVWLEKDALAGVIHPVTAEFDVPLMVTRGFSSETFAFNAAQGYAAEGLPVTIYHLHDFDRAGVDASRDLERKLKRFAEDGGVDVTFNRLGVSAVQIHEWRLPTREPKRQTVADQKWPYPYACELDAIPPDHLRALVRVAIGRHMPAEKLRVLRVAEASERAWLRVFSEAAQ